MRSLLLLATTLAFTAASAFAQIRLDNVLVRMVPPGTESLVGAHMDDLKATTLFQKMLAAQKLPDLDRFAKETGFDPRRDVKEMLFAASKEGGVLLARGDFRVKFKKEELKAVRHGEYVIYVAGMGDSGFCILDKTLAVAGNTPLVEAALEEWKSGRHVAAEPLLARVKRVDPKAQLWGVSTGFATFLSEHMPRMTNGGVDFSKIFRDVEDTWFQMDMSKGLRADIHGTTVKEEDAVSLRDAAKGLVGFGRLSVPESQPELLRLWDGITVEQAGRTILIKADISQDLLDRLVQMMEMNQRTGPRVRPRVDQKTPEQKKTPL